MPELAEVEYYRKQWNVGLKQKVLSLDLHGKKRIFRGTNVEALRDTLTGATFDCSEAHGKQMLFRFGDGWLGVHLGMTGNLRVEPADFKADKHDHLVIHQQKQALVFRDARQFGRVLFHAGKEAPTWWAKRATDVLSKKFTLDLLTEILSHHRKAPLKAVLLMQNRFPGIGNWMADEILWQSKIHPSTPAGGLRTPQINTLHNKVQFVCAEALRIVGTDWGDLPDSWLFNYRWRKGGNCPRCKTALKHSTVGGRTTCWCPKCQPSRK